MNTNEQKLELFVKGLAFILKCDANLDKIEAEVLRLTDYLPTARRIVQVYGSREGVDSNEYLRGMYNGAECILATMEARIGDFKDAPVISKRGEEWLRFSDAVLNHIENYTVPQYGDKGSDNVSEYTPEECVLQSRKYAARFRRNQREGQDRLDLLKSAHYNCLTWTKLHEETETASA